MIFIVVMWLVIAFCVIGVWYMLSSNPPKIVEDIVEFVIKSTLIGAVLILVGIGIFFTWLFTS